MLYHELRALAPDRQRRLRAEADSYRLARIGREPSGPRGQIVVREAAATKPTLGSVTPIQGALVSGTRTCSWLPDGYRYTRHINPSERPSAEAVD